MGPRGTSQNWPVGLESKVMSYVMGLVHKDEGTAFGVTFPDLPGCFSAADQWDDVLPNAIEAVSLYLEDQPAPLFRGLDAMKSDPSIARDLAEGAFLVAVPVLVSDQTIVRTNVTFERGVLRAIDEAAKLRKLTRSAFLAEAAKREIVGR